MDPIYGYQVTNVEAQMSAPSSLLHFTRRMIEVRKTNPAFGFGTFTDLGGANPSVFSFLREYRHDDHDDVVLCVNNLSRFAQPICLDLRRFAGWTPTEMLGGVPFPPIGTELYPLTASGHGFYWFRLDPSPAVAPSSSRVG
jgi:maltose alpha-D-glucosyltransferase/alpha-amylase